MADNVTTQTGPLATIPTDTTIATHEVDGAQYQLAKVAFGDVGQAFIVSSDIPLPVVNIDAVDFGSRPYTRVSTNGLNEVRVKNGHGFVYSLQVFNLNLEPRYIKFFDLNTTPEAGVDEPVKNLLIPGSTAGTGFVFSWSRGLEFSNGIGFCLTTGIDLFNADPVDADEISVNIDFV